MMDKLKKLPTGVKIFIAIVAIGILYSTIFGIPVNENL